MDRMTEGTIHPNEEEVTIQTMKHVETNAVLSLSQLRTIHGRLTRHTSSDNLVVTLNNEYPILLTAPQVQMLKDELQQYIEQLTKQPAP